MEKDIYSPPDSLLVTAEVTQQTLATRGARFAASFVDMLIMLAFTLPLAYMLGGFDQIMQGQKPGFGYSVIMFVAGMVFFIAVNYRLLVSRGQTVGKKLLGIRIVDTGGGLPSGNMLLKRYAFYFVVPQIPFAGPLVSTVNLLFIFGSARRCLHDMVAGTNVVKTADGK